MRKVDDGEEKKSVFSGHYVIASCLPPEWRRLNDDCWNAACSCQNHKKHQLRDYFKFCCPTLAEVYPNKTWYWSFEIVSSNIRTVLLSHYSGVFLKLWSGILPELNKWHFDVAKIWDVCQFAPYFTGPFLYTWISGSWSLLGYSNFLIIRR